MTNVERSDWQRGNGWRRMLRWGVIAGLLVLPAVAMQFTGEVNWTAFDFLFAGGVLIGAGLVYELIASRTANPVYRTVLGLAVIGGVLAVWAWAVAGP
jgi:hypothetical protein